MDFAQRLKSLMEAKGTTNYQLAKAISCHQTTIANILNGSKPQARTKKAIAEYFGVSVSYLDGRTEAPSGLIFDSSILGEFRINEEYFPEHIKTPTTEADGELTKEQVRAIEKIKNMPPEELAKKMAALEAVLDM